MAPLMMLSCDEFKAVCPPHRLKDLEPLVKTLKGDEDKIRATIEEWWDEPEKVEPEWNDVNKKGSKKTTTSQMQRPQGSSTTNKGGGGRSSSYSRGGGGGRGFNREMRGGRGGSERRSRESSNDKGKYNRTSSSERTERPPPVGEVYSTGPPTRAKPAWESKPEKQDYASLMEGTKLKSASDPTFDPITQPPVAPPRRTTGNVWATKGSAHLIEAEKPKPLVYSSSRQQPSSQPSVPQHGKKVDASLTRAVDVKPQLDETEELQLLSSSPVNPAASAPISPDTTDTPPSAAAALVTAISPPVHIPTDDLDNMLPPSITGANGNAGSWKPLSESDLPHSPASHLASVGIAAAVSESQALPEQCLTVSEIEESVSATNDTEESVSQSLKPEDKPSPVIESLPAATSVISQPKSTMSVGILNMGKWDVPEDDVGLDFGFGSFGPDNDQHDLEEDEILETTSQPKAEHTPVSSLPVNNTSEIPSTTVSVSPARPPPGLSITGMPPMPANAVLVHELENKLESASLNSAPKKSDDNPDVSNSQNHQSSNIPSSLSDKSSVPVDLSTATQTLQQQPQIVSNYPEAAANHVLPGMSQYTAVYGMGMYNYNPSSLGNYVGMHTPTGPVLAGGVLPQQQQQKVQQNISSMQQQQGTTPAGLHSHQQQQGGLYGAPTAASNVGIAASEASGTSSSEASTSAGGLPPGIAAHGAIPYNPALYHGQQYYQMGQPHGGVGYGYGYGAQYGGAVQGGFGYQQVMSQNGAYGQPYDDSQQLHSSQGSHHNNSSGYQKSGHGASGYRGRSHHSSHHTSHGNAAHQYQNQYTPQQHGAYAAQPYMAYSVDHFSQRGGYGPASIDPYSMQQGSGYQSTAGHTSAGSYSSQEDGDQQMQHKGKQRGSTNRGGFGTNPNIQQFQQVPTQQQGVQSQQQSYGLSDSTSAGNASNAGWSNPTQRWVNWQNVN